MMNLLLRRGYRGLIFLGLLGVIPYSTSLAQSADSLVGDWQGTVPTQFGDIRMVFHVREADDGLWLTLDSPDQGAKGIPAEPGDG